MRQTQSIRRAWGAAAGLGVLACLLLTASPADAKHKTKLPDTRNSAPTPCTTQAHPTISAPDASKASTKADPARPSTAPEAPVNNRSRGFFARMLDWVLWGKPAPAQVRATPQAPPQVPSLAPGSVPPAAQARPPRPSVSVPARVAEPELAWLSVPVAPAVLSGVPPRVRARPNRQEVSVRGYVIHLNNGNRIPVALYEDTKDEVVIAQYGGSYGLPKSLVARIEEVRDDGRGAVGSPKR